MERKERLTSYLNAIYQNTKTALQSIEDIMPKVMCKNLKDEIAREQDAYYVLARECEVFAKSEKIEGIKDNNWIEKAKLWTSVNMATLTDKSNRKIAELMLMGTFMGVITCYKDQADHKDVSPELDEIVERLKELERNNITRLIPFLNE